MERGIFLPNGSFRPESQIKLEAEMRERGFITTNPQFTQTPLIEQFINRQAEVNPEKPRLKWFFNNEPILNFMADHHLGGDCDYRRLQEEHNRIMNTRNSFVIIDGDFINSFAFNPAQMEQIEQVPRQILLAKEIIDKLTAANRLLVVLPGNHEGWMQRAGVNIYDLIVDQRKVPVVYGVNYFTFNVQGTEYKCTISHELKGFSIHNPTHPQMRENTFGAEGADLIISAHNHRKGFTQYYKKEHGGGVRQVTALALGTYKYGDGYSDKNGYPRQVDPEMGGYAVILKKNKKVVVDEILDANH